MMQVKGKPDEDITDPTSSRNTHIQYVRKLVMSGSPNLFKLVLQEIDP